MYTYEFDIYKKEIIADCKLYPTDIFKSEAKRLYAKNNKYGDKDPNKAGKWMVFLPKNKVNAIWDKVKVAVTNGDLWLAKVSTSDPDNPNLYHVIMIYTKDFADINDVIDVLNYLESSGIKPPQKTIRYKTDEQTHRGVYKGGSERPWIYSSSTIRQIAANVA